MDWRCFTRSIIANRYSATSECAWNTVYWRSAALTTTGPEAFARSGLGGRPCRRHDSNSCSLRGLSPVSLPFERRRDDAADARVLRQNDTTISGDRHYAEGSGDRDAGRPGRATLTFP